MLKEDTYLDNNIPSTIDKLNEIKDLESTHVKNNLISKSFIPLRTQIKKQNIFYSILMMKLSLQKVLW